MVYKQELVVFLFIETDLTVHLTVHFVQLADSFRSIFRMGILPSTKYIYLFVYLLFVFS